MEWDVEKYESSKKRLDEIYELMRPKRHYDDEKDNYTYGTERVIDWLDENPEIAKEYWGLEETITELEATEGHRQWKDNPFGIKRGRIGCMVAGEDVLRK